MTKKKPEHNVFQLIANVQSELQQKKASRLEKKLARLTRMREAWLRTGIPQMWEDVKHIEVVNFAKNDVAGERAPLISFVVPHEHANIYDHGLALYSKNGGQVYWYVDEQASNSPNPVMCYYGPRGIYDNVDDFRASFVEWLARKIDPRVIVDLGYVAKEIKKTDRRILVETETA